MLVSNDRKKDIPIHDKAANIIELHFDLCDYELARRIVDVGHYPQYMWFGQL